LRNCAGRGRESPASGRRPQIVQRSERSRRPGFAYSETSRIRSLDRASTWWRNYVAPSNNRRVRPAGKETSGVGSCELVAVHTCCGVVDRPGALGANSSLPSPWSSQGVSLPRSTPSPSGRRTPSTAGCRAIAGPCISGWCAGIWRIERWYPASSAWMSEHVAEPINGAGRRPGARNHHA